VTGAAACSSGPVLPEGSDAAVAAYTEDDGPPADPVVLLETDESGVVRQAGSAAAVEVRVVRLKKGAIGAAPVGDRWAIDYPRFRKDDARYPRAVLRVTSTGPQDELDPAGRDLVWGADIRIDRASAGNDVDNGDNIVQRGLSGDPAFFKAELDNDRAACTVTGRGGTLVVRASEYVRPGRWYRVRCSLAGNQLAVFVTELGDDGPGRSYASRAEGRVGTIAFRDPTTPLAVGGKIGHDGRIVRSATDQFNGLVLDPYLAFDD